MNYRTIIIETFQEARRAIERNNRRGTLQRPLGVGASGDVTYEIDRAVEFSILNSLRNYLPEFLAITEESGILGNSDDRPVILIDPVDGSTNASHGIPLYSSTVAIANGYRFEDIEAAGVIDLVHGDIFTGEKNGGVQCNGESVSPSHVRNLEEAIVCIDTKIEKEQPEVEEGIVELLSVIRYPRLLGTAALETAYAAVGRIDAFVEPRRRLRSYDCLPSLFLVKEAGGFFESLTGKAEDLDLRQTQRGFAYVAAGNKGLCRKIHSFFKCRSEC